MLLPLAGVVVASINAPTTSPWILAAVLGGYAAGFVVWRVKVRRPLTSRATHDRRALTPIELPASPALLHGREQEIDKALTYLAHPGNTGSKVLLLHGQPGIGKTALAIHVARQLEPLFSNGLLYASLGRSRTTDALETMLLSFLQVLEPTRPHVSQGLENLSADYRAAAAGKRVLIIVDDATEEVANLLTGSSAALILTSRDRIGIREGLVIHLKGLPEPAAVALLGEVVGTTRVEREPGTAAAIVEACQYNPLAVQLAGSVLAGRPSSPLSLAMRTSDRDAIDGSSLQPNLHWGPSTRSHGALDFSYALLPADERQALLQLGVIDGEFAAWNLRALMGSGASASDALKFAERLASGQLVERASPDSTGVPFFRTPEYVHDYARGRAQAELDPAERDLILSKVNDFRQQRDEKSGWAHLRRRVYQQLDEGNFTGANDDARDALALAREKLSSSLGAEDRTAEGLALMALAELRAELGGTDEVLDLVNEAWEIDSPEVKARVCRVLGHVYRRVRRLNLAMQVLEDGLRYANDTEDTFETIRILCELALVSSLRRRPQRGFKYETEARRLCYAQGDSGSHHLPRVLTAAAMVYLHCGRINEALRLLIDADERAQVHNVLLWGAWAQLRLAQAHATLQSYDDATTASYKALELFASIRHRYGTGHCRLLLARVYEASGQLAEASTNAEEALETFRTCDDWWIEANAALLLANLRRRQGQRARARRDLRHTQRLIGSSGRSWRWEIALESVLLMLGVTGEARYRQRSQRVLAPERV